MVMTLSGLNIYSEEGVIEQGSLTIKDEMIQSIQAADKLSDHHGEILSFPKGYHLLPGFIDLHIHGANNSDVMDATFSALETISHALAKEGVTGFLATTMTATPPELEKVLATTRDFMLKQSKDKKSLGAKVLGVHLEGPFLSPKKIGAQPADKVTEPQLTLMERWHMLSPSVIKLMTIAPELSGSLDVIKFLVKNDIVASIGHTNATYQETLSAIEVGASYATHLFNAMRQIHHREPGVAIAALLSDKVTAELVLDGHHLHPAMVEFALKLKGKNQLVLVTDAMRAKCLRDGTYDLGGQTVEVKNNRANLANGTLAGSVLTMNQALKNLLHSTDFSLLDAIQMTSVNPARILNLFERKGSISVGKDADLVVLNSEFEVVLTIREGQVIYQHPL